MKLFSLKRIQKPISKIEIGLYSTRQVMLYTRLIQLGLEPSIEAGYMNDGIQVKIIFDVLSFMGSSGKYHKESFEDVFFYLFGGDFIPGTLKVYYEEGGIEVFSMEEIADMEKQHKHEIDVPLID